MGTELTTAELKQKTGIHTTEAGGYHLEIVHHVAGGSLGAFLLVGLIVGLYAFRHYWRKYKAQIIQRAVNEANDNNIEQFQLA